MSSWTPVLSLQPSPHSVHGIYCSPADGNPLLLTAGSDMRIRSDLQDLDSEVPPDPEDQSNHVVLFRFWDLAYPERSYIVAGGAHDSLHCPSVLYSRKIIEGTEVVQVNPQTRTRSRTRTPPSPVSSPQEIHSKQKSGAPDDSPRRGLEALPVGHHDIITDIATFQTTQGFIVTSSRDGIVKVWK